MDEVKGEFSVEDMPEAYTIEDLGRSCAPCNL
jgi:hypothetical protein